MYDVGDIITYRAADGYNESYIITDLRQLDNRDQIKISTYPGGGDNTDNMGWFYEYTFKSKMYSVTKFELPYDPNQMPDEEDDI